MTAKKAASEEEVEASEDEVAAHEMSSTGVPPITEETAGPTPAENLQEEVEERAEPKFNPPDPEEQKSGAAEYLHYSEDAQLDTIEKAVVDASEANATVVNPPTAKEEEAAEGEGEGEG